MEGRGNIVKAEQVFNSEKVHVPCKEPSIHRERESREENLLSHC